PARLPARNRRQRGRRRTRDNPLLAGRRAARVAAVAAPNRRTPEPKQFFIRRRLELPQRRPNLVRLPSVWHAVMPGIVRIALSRPYTSVVRALLILINGPLSALRTPTDIFPNINIPIVAVAFQYTGLPPDQMAGRITTPFQRALTTTVN